MLALSKDLALEQGSLAELEKRTEQLNQAKTEREEQVRGMSLVVDLVCQVYDLQGRLEELDGIEEHRQVCY